MALIICPECGKSFSDKAPACPECGCPTSEITGSNNSGNEGQISVANLAFEDGRYDEAYQLFSHLYTQSQNNPQILVRLGLATAARDYFNNEIPNSTIELIKKGLESAKSTAPSYDAFITEITPLLSDVEKVIADTKTILSGELSSALNKLEYQRSAGAIMTDALFMPMTSAHRNIYEDRRTIESNKKVLENALANRSKVVNTLDEFRSSILGVFANVITEPIDGNGELYKLLGHFVINKDDAKIYETLTNSEQPQASIMGLCFGEETNVLDFTDVCAWVYIKGKPRTTGLKKPQGKLTLTNYKIEYKAKPEKWSFQKTLENLIQVKAGDPWSNKFTAPTFIELDFSDNTSIYISPKPIGSQAMYAALVNEMLKMPNR